MNKFFPRADNYLADSENHEGHTHEYLPISIHPLDCVLVDADHAVRYGGIRVLWWIQCSGNRCKKWNISTAYERPLKLADFKRNNIIAISCI